MISFQMSMDKESLNIVRDGKRIGFLQWHSDRHPRIILHEAGEYLSITEAIQCLSKFSDILEKGLCKGELYEQTRKYF